MRSARFHPEAEFELQAEATYYEEHSKGLGERFSLEVEAAVKVARTFSYIGSPYKYGTRRVYPRKFPFSVVYLVRSNEIVVLAIAPFAKRPGYWRSRRRVV